MHAFQVPRQTSQGPFTIDRLQSADMEPPEPHYFLDNPKHRLHRGFAPCVYCFAVRRLQAMLHPRYGISIWRTLGYRLTPFRQRLIVLFPAERDIGCHVFRLAACHIILAEITRIRQQPIRLPNGIGQRVQPQDSACCRMRCSVGATSCLSLQ